MSRILSFTAALVLILSVFSFGFSTAEAASETLRIDIDNTVFPDEGFLQFILDQGYDRDRDMKLSEAELADVTEMNCESAPDDGSGIRDLTGIEHFRYLTDLDCSGNLLQELDVSRLARLVRLDCSSNMIASLDMSRNPALETLSCAGNSMRYLSVSECYSLISLDCEDNELTSLDISWCSQLDDLSCASNSSLKVLDITSTPLIRNYILTTPRVDNGTSVSYGEYVPAGQVNTLYHVEMDPVTEPYSNDTGRNLDVGINADPFLITTIIIAYMLTGRIAGVKKDGRYGD
ncbi:MAG: hypothetical protein IJG67_03540 [Oscillospiraceae bacterium]|nr:hypothetical protein [Oscillospiraceae bacterium]